MIYQERPPCAALSPYVRCFWRMQHEAITGAGPPDRVVPDGCPEIVLNAADVFVRHEDAGHARPQAQALVVGALTRALYIAPTGAVDLIGIRFEPAGLYALTGLPMHQLTDQDVPLDAAHSTLARALMSAPLMGDFQVIAAQLEELLLRVLRSAARFRTRGALAAQACSIINSHAQSQFQSQSQVQSIEQVAQTLGVTRRSLERDFSEVVGITPKRLQRIARFQQAIQQAIQQAHDGGPAQWTQMAHSLGFTDQAHFIHDFKELAGTTPNRFLAEQNDLADQFYSGS